MDPLRGGYGLAALSLIVVLSSAMPLHAQPPVREQPRFGGVRKVAIAIELPTHDPQRTTLTRTLLIMSHVFEMLYGDVTTKSPIRAFS